MLPAPTVNPSGPVRGIPVHVRRRALSPLLRAWRRRVLIASETPTALTLE